MAKKKITRRAKKIGIGAAITAAVAATAAGAYFFYASKNAKQNRAKVKSWAMKAKAEVLDKLEKLDDIDRERYLRIVEKAVARYAAGSTATKNEVSSLLKELNDSWSHIERSAKTGKK